MPVAPTDLSQLIEQGKALEQGGHYEDALALYESILRDAPEYALAVARKARCLSRLRRHEEALTALEQAYALRPAADMLPYWGLRANTLRHLKRYTEADEDINKVLAKSPDNVPALLTKYYIARDLRNADEALAAIAHAAEVAPENAEAIEQYAATLYHLKRFEEAIPLYERASELAPRNSTPVYWKGRTLSNLERYEEALAAYQQAIALNPNFAHGWRMLTITLNQLGRTNEALTACKHELAVSDAADAWHQKAMILGKLGRFDETVTALGEVISRRPDDVRLVHDRAALLLQLKRYDAALAELEQGLSRFPDNVALLKLKGSVLHGLARYNDAIVAWMRVLELDPDEAMTLRNLIRAYEQQERFGDVLLPTNRLLARDERDGFAWAARIKVLYALGRFEDALAASIEAQRLLSENADIKGLAEFVERKVRRTSVDRHITLRDGRRMEYIELGAPEGYPILCCHGMPGSRLDFSAEDSLAREMGVRLITPDRPGYGLSDPKRRQSLLGWADDAEELADALGLERFDVLGVSGGGAYACACAYKLPSRVHRLALISSAAPVPQREAWRGFFWFQRIAHLVPRVTPWPLYAWANNLVARLIRAEPMAQIAALNKALGDKRKPVQNPIYPPTAIESAVEPFRQSGLGLSCDSRLLARPWDFSVKGISVPTLLWQGENDRLAPPVMGHYLVENIPNCRATFYADEGHDLSKHWAEVLRALLQMDAAVPLVASQVALG